MAESLRDRLAAKRRRDLSVELLWGDADEAGRAEARLAASAQVLAQAERRCLVLDEGTPQHAQALQDRLAAREVHDTARDARDAYYQTLTFRPLPPADWEALKAAHAESPSEGIAWNRETLRVPLITACLLDSDLTEDEWAAAFASGTWSTAERDVLYNTAVAAQHTLQDRAAGKGSSGTQLTPPGWRTAARAGSPSRSS